MQNKFITKIFNSLRKFTGRDMQEMFDAIHSYDAQEVRLARVGKVLAEGVSTSAKTQALHAAISYHGNPDLQMMKLLLDNGADVNGYFYGKGLYTNGYTPLHQVVFSGNFRRTPKEKQPFMDALQLLLAYHADPTKRADGYVSCEVDYRIRPASVGASYDFAEGKALLHKAETEWKKSIEAVEKRRAVPGNTLGL